LDLNVKIPLIVERNIQIKLINWNIQLCAMVILVNSVKILQPVIKIKAMNVQIGWINHQIHHYLVNHKGQDVLKNVILLIKIQLIMKYMIQYAVELLELIATKKMRKPLVIRITITRVQIGWI